MMQAEWLPIIMEGAFNEIYILNGSTLAFIEANASACNNLQYGHQELAAMTLTDVLLEPADAALEQLLEPLRQGTAAGRIVFDASHRRKDGSVYPAEVRLFCCGGSAGSAPVIIGIAKDISARREYARALQMSQGRLQAIVSNMPGLVYQFQRRTDGSIRFPYLSEGCHALLGIPAQSLCADPDLFLELVLPEDRQSYLDAMDASAGGMTAWNWEGRIWVETWKDIKWINLRAIPRDLPGGGVQWEGIMSNITQSKLEEAEIKRSREQLAELSAHVESVKEKERMRIAREIHDDLGGNLTAIKMALELLRRRLPAGDAALAEKAGYLDALVDRTIEAAHRISADLRPGILDFGIVAAIEWQAREFESQFDIACDITCNKKDIELESEQATALFRIFQEALTNIGKHAGATRIKIALTCSPSCIRLDIADNGRGIAITDRLKPGSFGIRGMIERASALGGYLSVNEGPTGGCVVALRMPLSEA